MLNRFLMTSRFEVQSQRPLKWPLTLFQMTILSLAVVVCRHAWQNRYLLRYKC